MTTVTEVAMTLKEAMFHEIFEIYIICTIHSCKCLFFSALQCVVKV